MARRAKGEGSWSEVNVKGKMYQRYTIAIDGVKRTFYGSNKTEARQKYKDYLKKKNPGVKSKTLTLVEAAWEMLEMKKTQVKKTTYTAYETDIKYLSKDPIARSQVSGLTAKDIQKYIDSLVDKKTIKGIKNQRLLIKMTLDYCVDFGMIEANPVEKVKLPNEANVLKETRDPVFLTTEERHKVEEETKRLKPNGKPFYIGHGKDVIVFILHTGLRISEVVALTWKDVDFKKNRISVNKNAPVVKTEDGWKPETTTPKTKNAVRKVPLDDTAREILDELYQGGKKDSDYVFTSLKGGMISRRNIVRTLDNVIERSGIEKKPGLHDLRHTFASELIRKGADIKTVSRILGHANVSTTLNIYVHKSDDDLDQIKGLLD